MAEDFSRAIIVNSVPEEYQIVNHTLCSCGGNYIVKMQSLIEKSKKHYDILHCICKSCGSEREFIFDINSFFGKMFQ